MTLIKRLLCITIVFFTVTTKASPRQGIDLSSPDGRIAVQLTTGKALSYAVTVDGKPLINASGLGFVLQGSKTFGSEPEVVQITKRTHDSSWNNPLGKTFHVRDHYNELLLQLKERSANNDTFQVVFRVFNDGVAFRYVLPGNSIDSLTLTKEQTEFNFAGDYNSYSGHHEKYNFRGSQEWEFLPGKLSDIKADSAIGLPLLVQSPVAWVAVTESDLLNWAGMWLMRSSNSNTTFSTSLAPRLDQAGLVKGTGGQASPWRVLMIGRKPGDLVESNIVLNLASPSVIGDVSWIKPGLMAWDHWWSGDVQMNTATLKQYIQLAADMGWPYQLIDWQWYGKFNNDSSDITHVNPAVDMDEVRRFAKEKNVRLWLWLYWTDVERHHAYEKAFALYESWGMAGIKIDFMDRDDQEMVNWYEKIAKAAADHHLMLDFHGAYKPTGLERTYPNQITREGVLGNEYNRWSRRVTSKHKLTLPFTRMLAGPADFTPGGFLNRQPNSFKPDGAAAEVQGTRAAELALFVVYQSPITVACDHPDHYRDQPGADFLKLVPTVWDETKVLQASVADYMVMARRKGNEWFVGALTDSTPRSLNIPLSFLGRGKYRLSVWKDAADSDVNAGHIEKEERVVTKKDHITISMAPNGGYTARLVKQ